MKLPAALSIGLLTVISVSIPTAQAHNSARYANVPFLVPSSCSDAVPGVSSQFISSGGTIKLQVVTSENGGAGGTIYTSIPGTPRSNHSPPVTTGTFPQGGQLTFNVSGLPATGGLIVFVSFADGSNSLPDLSIVNGTVSGSITGSSTPGSAVSYIQVIPRGGVSGLTTVTLSNFRYSNQPLLSDTTISLTVCGP